MITEREIVIDKKSCIQCEALIDADCRFCNNCGVRQSNAETKTSEAKWSVLKLSATFYAIDILVCALSKFVPFFDTVFWLLFFEVFIWIATVCFFAINWAENKKLLGWKSFSWQKLAAYCSIAMAGSFMVHYAAGWLNIVIFSKDEEYYTLFRGNIYAEAILIFLTAITTALFEELGYRGFLLQNMLKVTDKHQAIIITAFLFAIIHLSFISLFWLIPFALLLGYVRVKENTLWYGIFFHFCFNLTACLFELL